MLAFMHAGLTNFEIAGDDFKWQNKYPEYVFSPIDWIAMTSVSPD